MKLKNYLIMLEEITLGKDEDNEILESIAILKKRYPNIHPNSNIYAILEEQFQNLSNGGNFNIAQRDIQTLSESIKRDLDDANRWKKISTSQSRNATEQWQAEALLLDWKTKYLPHQLKICKTLITLTHSRNFNNEAGKILYNADPLKKFQQQLEAFQ